MHECVCVPAQVSHGNEHLPRSLGMGLGSCSVGRQAGGPWLAHTHKHKHRHKHSLTWWTVNLTGRFGYAHEERAVSPITVGLAPW